MINKERYVKRLLQAATALVIMVLFSAPRARAQGMDDMNLQVHGYATQGFLYSNQNSWDTTDSEHGSAAWTEAVVNLSVQPQPKLRIGIQARYFLLGDYGNTITMDWAQGDYRVNEYFGIRAGKVKTPSGLFNESQDIDPAQLWVLLPQSVYPLASRNSVLAHYGAVAYGSIPLGESLGKLEYHAFGGRRVLGGDDGFFQPFRAAGLNMPNGIAGPLYGAGITWHTPVSGLMFGVTDQFEHPSGEITVGPLQGTFQNSRLDIPYFFGRYEGSKVMFAGEYNRIPVNSTVQFPGLPAFVTPIDQRAFYVMGSYKIAAKLTGGMYYSSIFNRQAALGSNRYQKDWDLSARYDFNPFLYAKVEQHFIDGTFSGFSASDNPNLQPDTRMTMLKVGVSF
jgi:hypothetical protein